MQVASRKQRRSVPAEPEAAVARRRSPLAPHEDAARQNFLDALPIASAVLCVTDAGESYVEAANEHFCALAGWHENWEGDRTEQNAFLNRSAITGKLLTFVESGEIAQQFDSHDGQLVG